MATDSARARPVFRGLLIFCKSVIERYNAGLITRDDALSLIKGGMLAAGGILLADGNVWALAFAPAALDAMGRS